MQIGIIDRLDILQSLLTGNITRTMRTFFIFICSVSACLGACQNDLTYDCFELANNFDSARSKGTCSSVGYIIDIGGSYFLADTEDEYTYTVIVGLNPPPLAWIDRLEQDVGSEVAVMGPYEKIDNTIITITELYEFKIISSTQTDHIPGISE